MKFTLVLVLLLTAPFLFAQEGDTLTDTTAVLDTTAVSEAAVDTTTAPAREIIHTLFNSLPGDTRNLAILRSDGQFETTVALSDMVSGSVDIGLDSIRHKLGLEVQIDLANLTTGFKALDSAVFSDDFLNFDTLTNAKFNLLSITRAKEYFLRNEQSLEITGTGEFSLNSLVDTIVVVVRFTYMEENKVTQTKMDGDLLHVNGKLNFRLSDYGIKISKSALLKLNDVIKLEFDFFTTTGPKQEL